MEREEIALNKLYQIYYIGITNFLDRIRDKSVILITLFMMYVAYLFFPEKNTSIYYTLNIQKKGFFYRGIYNSTWLGWISTIAFISIISLIGFYFVSNSIKREKQLLVGEISASMPIKSSTFVFGKTFGNFLFLLLQMTIVILITIAMQFVRGESYSIEIMKIVTPFLLLALPACLIVSVISIAFEIIPFLTGTIGNVIYFFTWIVLIVLSVSKIESVFTDIFGMNAAISMIIEQMKLNFKALQGVDGFSLGASGRISDNIKTFVMNNVNIKSNIFIGRFFWITVAFLLIVLLSLIFRRSLLLEKKAYGKMSKIKEETSYECNLKERIVTLTPLFENRTYLNNLSIINDELKIIVKALPAWWYIFTIIFSICAAFTTGEVQNKIFIPLIWILPIVIWAKLGSAEKKFNMETYLFTYNNYRSSQLINSFIASFIFTILINTGILIRFILTNNIIGALYILMAAFFVTSLGIFVGNATGSSTVFEVVYLMLWYVGILNGLPQLNFLGTSQKVSNINIPSLFFIIGAGLLIVSIVIKICRIKRLYN